MLERFVEAQETDYQIALNEIKNGRKRSHWMWYVFPQIKGLGCSWAADYYGIRDLKEAKDYLAHPILGTRLLEISEALLQIDGRNAREIFGYTDEKKLKSSMTLFYHASNQSIFREVLEKYFRGKMDEETIKLLKKKE